MKVTRQAAKTLLVYDKKQKHKEPYRRAQATSSAAKERKKKKSTQYFPTQIKTFPPVKRMDFPSSRSKNGHC